MGWRRICRGVVASLVFVSAVATGAVPALAGKKPAKTKTTIVQYMANGGAPAKTIYRGRLFSIKAECEEGGSGPTVTFVRLIDGSITKDFLVLPGTSESNTSTGDRGQRSTVEPADATGELISFDRKLKAVATVDHIYQATPIGLNKACVYAGVVSELGERAVISAKTNGTSDLRSPQGLNLDLECSQDGLATILGSSGEDNLTAVNHIDEDSGMAEQRVFRPLTGPSPLLVPPASFGGNGDFGDIIFLSGAVNATMRFATLGSSFFNFNRNCVGVGFRRSARGNFEYFDIAPQPRRVFYSERGLKLSASCSSGQLSVFASTTAADSLLHATALGDGAPVEFSDTDFSEDESDPLFVLNLQNISRNGQIAYLRPDGKTVFVNYFAANQGTTCRVAGTSATA